MCVDSSTHQTELASTSQLTRCPWLECFITSEAYEPLGGVQTEDQNMRQFLDDSVSYVGNMKVMQSISEIFH